LVGMGGHMSCYGWAWVGTYHAMGGHMSCYGWAWVGTYHAMGGHRSLLMGMVWHGYKFEGKCWALNYSLQVQGSSGRPKLKQL
jgi:hypothetical protein